MNDAVSSYRTASESGEVERILELLSPSAELVSPVSGRLVFRGREDLRILFEAVYGLLSDVT